MQDREYIDALPAALKAVRLVIEGHPDAATKCLAECPSRPEVLAGVLQTQCIAGFVFTPDGSTVLPCGWNQRLTGQLRDDYAEQARFVNEMLGVLCQASDTLARAGIQCIALKGALFGHRYYDTCFRRRVRDLDLLVEQHQVDECLALMASIGYASPHSCSNAHSLRMRRFEHAICLENGRKQIDIHWQLRNAAYDLNYEQIWQSAQTFVCDGRSYKVLSPEDEITFHMLSIAHDLRRGACKIKHLADALSLIRRHGETISWSEFFKRRRREGSDTVCLSVLDLLTHWFQMHGVWPEFRSLVDHAAQRIVRQNRDLAIRLLAEDRGSPFNQAWFDRVYPSGRSRAVRQMLDRNFSSPGRIPWLAFKGIKRLLAA